MRSALARLGLTALVVAGPALAQSPAPQSAPQSAPGSVPNPFQLSATVRARYEAIDGQARAGFNTSDGFFNLRTTVLATYDTGPLKFAAELWDSRVRGANRGSPLSTGEVNTLEFVQAFAQADLGAFAGPDTTTTLQAGRFLLNLGSRRLIAADDYRNTTNGYTGLRLDIATKSGWHATAIYTLPQRRLPDDLDSLLANKVVPDTEGFNLVLWGGLAAKTQAIGPATAEMSYFHLGERDEPGRPTRDRSLDTLSLRLIRDPAPARFDYEVEAIAQTGRTARTTAPGAAAQQVRAWFVHADAGYTFASHWRPRLSIEYDHASGDGRGGTYRRFDPLFGMRRADLAPGALYNAIVRANFASPGLRLEAVPDKRTDLLIGYRPMWLASRFDAFSSTGVRDATGRSGRFAGHQLDTRIRYRINPHLQLEADAVLLAKGRFLRDAPNAPPGRWTRYISLNAATSF